MNRFKLLIVTLLQVVLIDMASADSVKILDADFRQTGKGVWTVHVTLSHADTGWEHYADNWQVVDKDGNVLGDRVLYHPHVNEQPFTRSLSGVKIPAGIETVFIRAHDKKHGWSDEQLPFNPGK